MSFSIPGIPKSLRETDALLADLDACLMGGFARLGENGKNALSATSRVFNTSPLGENLAGAVEELIAGRFSNDAFAMIAAARTALLGAQYDALAGEIANAIGVEFLPVPETFSILDLGAFTIYENLYLMRIQWLINHEANEEHEDVRIKESLDTSDFLQRTATTTVPPPGSAKCGAS